MIFFFFFYVRKKKKRKFRLKFDVIDSFVII